MTVAPGRSAQVSARHPLAPLTVAGARPVENLVAIVDRDTGEVIEVQDAIDLAPACT